MGSKIIIRVHSTLPKNRKSTEISEYMRKLVYTTFTTDEYRIFVEDMKCLVAFLNSKYPQTKEFEVWEHPFSNSLSIGSSSDQSIWATFCPIGKSYSER